MRDEHIIDILDESPIDRLDPNARARVEAHVAGCASCMRAFDAARIAGALVEARAGEIVEPAPFFHTRVMAAIRERQPAETLSFGSIWRAARLLVGAMAVVVVLLGAANLLVYRSQPETPAPEIVAGQTLYSPQWDALEQPVASRGDLSDDQLMTLIYETEDGYGQGR